jgi:hypothetical protein
MQVHAVKKQLPPVAAALGLLGSLLCSTAMVIAFAGLIGAGTAATATSAGAMAGMGGTPSTPPVPSQDSSLHEPLLAIVLFLIQSGPVILIVSIAAIALAVGIRRRATLFPVVVAGLVLYWGMYMQAVKLAMYSSVALGLVTLAAASIWSMRAITSAGPRASNSRIR